MSYKRNLKRSFRKPQYDTISRGVLKTDYDEPTYLTFKIEFGANPGASLEFDPAKGIGM